MIPVEVILRRLERDLAAAGHRWALIGGFAVSARAGARFTRDVDLAVAVRDDAEAETLVGRLLRDRYHLAASLEQDDTGRLATVRLLLPEATESGTLADLLFASAGIEPEVAVAATPVEVLAGLTVPVARTGHLVALKLLSRDDARRPLDAADLLALREVADAEELELARAAVALITARGYHRGRDLAAALAMWWDGPEGARPPA